jgi:hypothetical protein
MDTTLLAIGALLICTGGFAAAESPPAWPEFTLPSDLYSPSKAKPIPIDDVFLSLGIDEEQFRQSGPISNTIKFGIIDRGFNGIQEYLNAHPEEKNKVGFKNASAFKGVGKASHGYNVFRFARKALPNAQILLIREDGSLKSWTKGMEMFAKNGVFLVNMSISPSQFMGELQGGLSENSFLSKMVQDNQAFHALLEKYEITLFQGVGNDRTRGHYFPYQDKNNDGYLEFRPKNHKFGSKSGKTKTLTRSRNYIYVKKGVELKVKLFWNEWPHRRSDFELQLYKGKQLKAQSTSGNDNPISYLIYKPEKNGYLSLRIVDKGSQQPERVRFFLDLFSGGSKKLGFFNGFEPTSTIAKTESSFLISVGAYGLGDNGKLKPSSFSSIGQGYNGSLLPHVIGPGQFILDGKVKNGTSYAGPFIAGLYAKYAAFNLKNYIEATSDYALLEENLAEAEKSRWGIPSWSKLNDNECTRSSRIENVQHRVENGNVIIDFEFYRNCMENISFAPMIYFTVDSNSNGKQSKSPVWDKPGNLLYWYGEQKKSQKRNIEAMPVTIKIPLPSIPEKFRSQKLEMHVGVMTKAHQTIDEFKNQGNYTFQLPK